MATALNRLSRRHRSECNGSVRRTLTIRLRTRSLLDGSFKDRSAENKKPTFRFRPFPNRGKHDYGDGGRGINDSGDRPAATQVGRNSRPVMVGGWRGGGGGNRKIIKPCTSERGWKRGKKPSPGNSGMKTDAPVNF